MESAEIARLASTFTCIATAAVSNRLIESTACTISDGDPGKHPSSSLRYVDFIW